MPPYPRPPRQRERLATRAATSGGRPAAIRMLAARCVTPCDPSTRELGARWLGASSASTSASTRAPPAASAAAAVLALQRRAAKARCGAQAEFQLRPTGSRRRVGVATRIRRAGAEFGICEPARALCQGLARVASASAGIDAHALGRSPRAQPRVLAAARRATLRTTQLRHDRRWSPPGSFACWLRCEARRIVGARPPIAHIAACGPRHRPWPRFHASGRSDFALLAVVRIGAMNLPLSPYPHLRSPEASVFLLPRPARFLAGAARSGAWPAYRYP